MHGNIEYFEITKIKDVGTDPNRYLGMREFADDLNDLAISKSMKTIVEPQEGYIPPLHDKPFKPSHPTKKGKIKGTLEKFPQYLPNPPTELKRKVLTEEEEAAVVPGFKATYRNKSRPTPSVATNYRNLKASYPSAFAR